MITDRLKLPPKKKSEKGFLGPLSPRVKKIIDLLMGLFGGAVFHDGVCPKNCPLALMGRFPSLLGRPPSLMDMGRFPSCRPPGKQPIKKTGIKRFLNKTYKSSKNVEKESKMSQKTEKKKK